MRTDAIISVSALALTVFARCKQGGGAIQADSHGRGTVPMSIPRLRRGFRPRSALAQAGRGSRQHRHGRGIPELVVSTDREQRYVLEAFARDEHVLGVTVS
jgi:hypothetical protein